MKTITELIKKSEMNMKEFSEYFDIPYRTVQDWKAGKSTPPVYVVELIEYKLENEKKFNKI